MKITAKKEQGNKPSLLQLSMYSGIVVLGMTLIRVI